MTRALLLALALLAAACTPPIAASPAPSAVAPTTAPATATATPAPTRPVWVPPACEGKPIATPPPPAAATTPTPDPERPISRDLQRLVFDTLADRIDETYLYEDFNGNDWPAMVLRYRAEILAGLDTDAFYRKMKEFVRDLDDEHSSFETPTEKARSDEQLRGNPSFVGIGVYMQPVPAMGYVTIIAVIPNSPAAHAGLQPHDAILSANGLPLVVNGVFQQHVRGQECSLIVLEVRTPGGIVERRTLIRGRVSGNVPVESRLVPTTDGSRIGYIVLPGFDDGTVDDQVRAALEAFGPLDGLIIDDRMNPGGASSVLTPVLRLFTSGTVGRFVSRSGARNYTFAAAPVANSQTVPLVVLTSGHTASFGEIFAGVLQDQGRATLVGSTTAGNVETLSAVNLPDGSRAWIAQEGFEPARGRAGWERTGVRPDVEVTAAWEDFTFERDPVVKKALEVLGRR